MSEPLTIVIAWAEKTKLVPTGRHVMRDLNYFPEFRTDWEGRAAAYKWDGTKADIEKARAYAATDGRQVYVYPASEEGVLDKARQAACKAAVAAEKASHTPQMQSEK